MKKTALTVFELLITVILAGVLASIGFVSYSSYKTKALEKEAQASLKLIIAAESVFRLERGDRDYYPTGAGSTDSTISTINTNLSLALPTPGNWSYSVKTNNGVANAEKVCVKAAPVVAGPNPYWMLITTAGETGPQNSTPDGTNCP